MLSESSGTVDDELILNAVYKAWKLARENANRFPSRRPPQTLRRIYLYADSETDKSTIRVSFPDGAREQTWYQIADTGLKATRTVRAILEQVENISNGDIAAIWAYYKGREQRWIIRYDFEPSAAS